MVECGVFADIHCHVLPQLDDGATSWAESLAMARIAVAEGIRTIVATPHQLGMYSHNRGGIIRGHVSQLQQLLERHRIPLTVLPGADVRIAPEMLPGLKAGEILTLGDTDVYVLLELPHDVYFPLDPVLDGLEQMGMQGILSHPERNEAILRNPELVAPLVQRGCPMQVTAGSLVGTFGPACQKMSKWLFEQGLAHIVATDAHGSRNRRPLMKRAFETVIEWVDEDAAVQTCCVNPLAVAKGDRVDLDVTRPRRRRFAKWLG
ncbi:MAG: tyrosine-protein phosphatase [Planctomycetota bacterium]